MIDWKVGMKVKKTLYGISGYTEETEGVITKIENGIIYVDEEWGITFDLMGKELENFFLPMRCEIEPLIKE